jgi:hypothetical protein
LDAPAKSFVVANEMTGSDARHLSGLRARNGNALKPGKVIAGNPQDAIRRRIYRLARTTYKGQGLLSVPSYI